MDKLRLGEEREFATVFGRERGGGSMIEESVSRGSPLKRLRLSLLSDDDLRIDRWRVKKQRGRPVQSVSGMKKRKKKERSLTGGRREGKDSRASGSGVQGGYRLSDSSGRRLVVSVRGSDRGGRLSGGDKVKGKRKERKRSGRRKRQRGDREDDPG